MKAQLATEVPIPHLQDMDALQDFGYALSYLCDQPGYIDYFKSVKQSGRKVILDNSYNELLHAEGVQKLFNIFDIMEPDLLIAPDNKKVPDEDHYKAYERCCNYLGDRRVIFVAHRQAHYDYATAKRIRHVAIAFPQRPAISNYFHSRGIPDWMTLHYLGLNHPMEVNECHYIDTTLPLKLVWLQRDFTWWRRNDYMHLSSHLFKKLFHRDILTTQLSKGDFNFLVSNTLALKGALYG